MCPNPARPGKIGDIQLDPTTRELTICLSKSWLLALAGHRSANYAKDLRKRVWTFIQKKNFTEITIRQTWRIHSKEKKMELGLYLKNSMLLHNRGFCNGCITKQCLHKLNKCTTVKMKVILFGTDPDRNRALEETPRS
jgi:hypothetical protein